MLTNELNKICHPCSFHIYVSVMTLSLKSTLFSMRTLGDQLTTLEGAFSYYSCLLNARHLHLCYATTLKGAYYFAIFQMAETEFREVK